MSISFCIIFLSKRKQLKLTIKNIYIHNTKIAQQFHHPIKKIYIFSRNMWKINFKIPNVILVAQIGQVTAKNSTGITVAKTQRKFSDLQLQIFSLPTVCWTKCCVYPCYYDNRACAIDLRIIGKIRIFPPSGLFDVFPL